MTKPYRIIVINEDGTEEIYKRGLLVLPSENDQMLTGIFLNLEESRGLAMLSCVNDEVGRIHSYENIIKARKKK